MRNAHASGPPSGRRHCLHRGDPGSRLLRRRTMASTEPVPLTIPLQTSSLGMVPGIDASEPNLATEWPRAHAHLLSPGGPSPWKRQDSCGLGRERWLPVLSSLILEGRPPSGQVLVICQDLGQVVLDRVYQLVGGHGPHLSQRFEDVYQERRLTDLAG